MKFFSHLPGRVPGFVLVALAFCPGPLPTAAQSRDSIFPEGTTIDGEVRSFDGSTALGSYSIQLVGIGDRRLGSQGYARAEGGRFSLAGIPKGDYELVVSDDGGRVLTQQIVWVGGGGSFITVHLPEEADVAQPVSGVVSLRTLRHKVPSRAFKEFEKAETAARKSRTAESITHLKQALEIDPAFMQAYNNLGTRYMEQGDFESAIPELQKALSLDDSAAPVATNLSLACYVTKRYPEAEKYARQSVKLASTSNKARYMLGLTLYAQGRNDADAFDNLKAAAREYPRARLMLADLLERQGNREQAAGQVREYLKIPKVEGRAAAEGWLANLETTRAASAPPPGNHN